MTTHFLTTPAWTWVNDPTGTSGSKAIVYSNQYINVDDTNKYSALMNTGSTWSGKSLYTVACIEYNCEGGIRIDDASNNILEFYLEYESAGKIKVMKRSTVSGTPTETALVTGLPIGYWGLLMYFSGIAGTGTFGMYLFKETSRATSLVSWTGLTGLTQSRYGIFSAKADNGTTRGAMFDWLHTDVT
jgi:hypothetical protein